LGIIDITVLGTPFERDWYVVEKTCWRVVSLGTYIEEKFTLPYDERLIVRR